MILDVYMHGRRHQPATWQETELLVTALVENVPEPEPHPDAKPVTGHLAQAISQVLEGMPQATWPYGGQTAEFTFTERSEGSTGGLLDFDSYLHVAVNARTGHGALMWMLTRGSTVAMDPSIADQVWLSDNPAPPSKDPNVIADPGFPLFHHPRSVLPVGRIRAAVEEYCRAGTGHRPTCIDWTPGQTSGRRLDSPVAEPYITHCEDPWCEIPEPEHPAH
ncbi:MULTISPECIES: Imm1 family immunity protein [unclassified Streptomyces]|uniref:Imm1 family immunity protein n=1 Tax=unclassified Streptomyces TaxID=2593676 RepID=UPI003442B571